MKNICSDSNQLCNVDTCLFQMKLLKSTNVILSFGLDVYSVSLKEDLPIQFESVSFNSFDFGVSLKIKVTIRMKIFAILITVIGISIAFAQSDIPCCNCPPPRDDYICTPHSCNMCYGHSMDEFEAMLARTNAESSPTTSAPTTSAPTTSTIAASSTSTKSASTTSAPSAQPSGGRGGQLPPPKSKCPRKIRGREKNERKHLGHQNNERKHRGHEKSRTVVKISSHFAENKRKIEDIPGKKQNIF